MFIGWPFVLVSGAVLVAQSEVLGAGEGDAFGVVAMLTRHLSAKRNAPCKERRG